MRQSAMGSMRERMGMVRPLAHLMLALFLHYTAIVMVWPALIDVTLAALCPGLNKCSLAIFLSGFQQAIAGIGTMLATPVLGSLSDEYGRKPLLMVPFTASIIPIAVLSYSRSPAFVYIYFVLRTIAGVVSEGSTTCLALAYVADTVEERLRAPAFGIMMGSLSTGFVMGTLLARGLGENHVFQVAALLSVAAAIYLKVFLGETNPSLRHPLISSTPVVTLEDQDVEPPKTSWLPSSPMLMRSRTSVLQTAELVRSSKLLMQVTLVAFFSNLGEAGLQTSLLYYLKATFDFGKDQFAELMLIAGGASVISQMIFMPVLVHLLGERKVLCIGLFASFAHAFLYGIAWSPWVPYAAALTGVLFVFVFPSIGSIVSKAAVPDEQGKLQGFVAGVRSFASIVAPLVTTPLTALFLSDKAPFHCPGFSIICSGIAMVVAFILGLTIPPIPHQGGVLKQSGYVQVHPNEDVEGEYETETDES